MTNGRQGVICVDLDTEKAKEPRSQLVNANDITDTVLDIKFCDLITIVLIVDYPQQYLTETKNCEISFRQQFAKRRTSSLFFFRRDVYDLRSTPWSGNSPHQPRQHFLCALHKK